MDEVEKVMKLVDSKSVLSKSDSPKSSKSKSRPPSPQKQKTLLQWKQWDEWNKESTGALPNKSSNQQNQKPPIQLKFHVERTNSRQLPVYVDYKKNRVITSIRKISGDKENLRSQLLGMLGVGVAVTIRLGRIDITGNHSKQLKTWLAQLGF